MGLGFRKENGSGSGDSVQRAARIEWVGSRAASSCLVPARGSGRGAESPSEGEV